MCSTSSVTGGGSSSIYLLNCSVCKTGFISKLQWERHLTQETHLPLARKYDYHNDKNTLRECSLVIFTTYDLTVQCADKVIQYFSSDDDKASLVTDFVWWEDRPRIGIVQFESRKIAEAFLKESPKLIRINHQDVLVKVALELLDLEWKAILQGYHPLSSTTSTEIPDTIELLDRIEKAGKCVTKTPSDHLYHQFQEVRNAVKIPDKISKRIQNIVGLLRQYMKNGLASSKVIAFRNRYLNLRSFTTSNIDPLLVYIYSLPKSPASQCKNVTWLSENLITKYLTSGISNNSFRCPAKQENPLGLEFIHIFSGTSIFVDICKQAMAEVQLSQLAKYYFEFDTRIRPLFYLAQYWKFTNDILFGQREVSREIFRKFLPEPYCLYWILITFLIHENVLPSVRAILARPHKPIIDKETGLDIGFHDDIQFARQWKLEHKLEVNTPDKFVMTVLQLFNKFLKFCSARIFDQDGVLINPKDGEVLKMGPDFQGNLNSKLSSEEISTIRANFQENSFTCWYMINPLITSWQFSLPDTDSEHVIDDVVKKTSIKFEKLLKSIENEGAEKAFQICGQSLCEMLKIDGCRLETRKRRIDNEPIDKNQGSFINKRVKNTTQSTTDPLVVLEELAKNKNWDPPVYFAGEEIIVNGKSFHFYSVVVNGRTFKQNRRIGSSVDKKDAKSKAARFCLESLGKLPKTIYPAKEFCSRRRRCKSNK